MRDKTHTTADFSVHDKVASRAVSFPSIRIAPRHHHNPYNSFVCAVFEEGL